MDNKVKEMLIREIKEIKASGPLNFCPSGLRCLSEDKKEAKNIGRDMLVLKPMNDTEKFELGLQLIQRLGWRYPQPGELGRDRQRGRPGGSPRGGGNDARCFAYQEGQSPRERDTARAG